MTTPISTERLTQALLFLDQCFPVPSPEANQGGQVNVAVRFYFPDSAMPQFPDEESKAAFVRLVSNVIGSSVVVSDVLENAHKCLVEGIRRNSEPELPLEPAGLRLVTDEEASCGS